MSNKCYGDTQFLLNSWYSDILFLLISSNVDI